MWRSKKPRRGSESSSSPSTRPVLEDDKIYLPDMSVFVTTTKSGKPAIARKKRDKLLEDYGFDLLGQTFGISSRADFERSVRPNATSDRPEPKSARNSLAPRIVELDTDDEVDDFVPKPKAKYGTDSSRSTSGARKPYRTKVIKEELVDKITPRPALKTRLGDRMNSRTFSNVRWPLRKHVTVEHEPSGASKSSEPESFTYRQGEMSIPPPPPPPAQHGCMRDYVQNQTPTYIPPKAYSALAPSYAYETTPVTYPLSHTTLHQRHSVSPYTYASYLVPQPSSMSMPPIQQQPFPIAPYTQLPQVTAFTGFPSPPPPPPASILHVGNGITLAGNQNGIVETMEMENIKNHFDTVVKPQLESQVKKRKGQIEHKDETSKKASDKSGQYKHMCAGCGKPRSKHYHMTHRLEPGETALPEYCRKCIAAADCTDSEATENIVHRDLVKSRSDPILSTDEDYLVSTGLYKYDKRSQRHTLHKKPRRGSFLKAVTASMTGKYPKRAASLSTPEESSSRASSNIRGFRVRRRGSDASNDRSARVSKKKSPLFRPLMARPSIKDIPATSVTSSRTSYLYEITHEAEPRMCNASHNSSRNVSLGLWKSEEKDMVSKGKSSYKRPSVRNEGSDVSSQILYTRNQNDLRSNHHFDTPAKADDTKKEDFKCSRHSLHNEASKKTSRVSGQDSGIKQSSGQFDSLGNVVAYEQNQCINDMSKSPARVHNDTYAKSLSNPLTRMNAFCSWDERVKLAESEEEPSPTMSNGGFESMPLTPADAEFGNSGAGPRVRRDSWEHGQDQFEEMAEQMAEDDLMRAGKRSGLFGMSWDGSATSALPTMSSHLTPSLISIESCDSDEDRVDGNANYQLSSGIVSDSGDFEPVEQGNTSPKQLDCSSHKAQVRKKPPRQESDSLSRFNPSSHNHVVVDSRNNSSYKGTKYNNPKADNSFVSQNSAELYPPSTTSSIQAHTGHSVENDDTSHDKSVCENAGSAAASSTRASRRRIRRHNIP